jgi:hypothetical protein
MADSIMMMFEVNDFKAHTGVLYNIGGSLGIRRFFNPNEGTLQQLKNAGGLRLVQKRNIVDSIQQYSSQVRDILRLQELEESHLVEYTNVMSKVFSARVFNKMLVSNTSLIIKKIDTNPSLISLGSQSINDLSMKILVTKANRIAELEALIELHFSAVRLIELIEKEYHLE